MDAEIYRKELCYKCGGTQTVMGLNEDGQVESENCACKSGLEMNKGLKLEVRLIDIALKALEGKWDLH